MIGMLIPDRADGGIRRAARLCLSLFLVLAILSPLGSLISGIEGLLDRFDGVFPTPDGAENDLSGLYESLADASRAEIEEKLCEYLRKEFSLPENGVSIHAQVSAVGGEVVIHGVTVYLQGSAMWEDPHEIKKYIEDITDAPCEVVTGR